jgi:hypothetical protein
VNKRVKKLQVYSSKKNTTALIVELGVHVVLFERFDVVNLG